MEQRYYEKKGEKWIRKTREILSIEDCNRYPDCRDCPHLEECLKMRRDLEHA